VVVSTPAALRHGRPAARFPGSVDRGGAGSLCSPRRSPRFSSPSATRR